MQKSEFWSRETNPETGAKFEEFLDYLKTAHNGNMDVDHFVDSDYGEAFAKVAHLRFRLEEDSQGEEAMAWYHAHGLEMKMYEDEDYYTRWMMLFPKDPVPGFKYPLVIANHGGSNSIETDEFSFGLPQIAGEEKFAVLYAQNTNVDRVEHLLQAAMELYPIDPERVYLTGYSQGGYQVTSTIFRMPKRFAAIGPCGNDIFREWDNFNVPYTEEEYKALKEAMVPVIQVVGACEASNFVPINDWAPRKNWGRNVSGVLYHDPRRNDDVDPTRIKGGKRPFSDMPVPPDGQDKHEWMMWRLNRRMDTLNCEPRDAKMCIEYLDTPEDELHHVLGFYGDREKIETWYGYKHYVLDIDNKDGMHAFRYVAVENSAHWPAVMMGQYVWNFFKQYRRDSETGKVVVDPYQNPKKQ